MAAFHWFSLFLILSTTIFVNAGRSRRSPIVTDDLARPNQFPWAVAIVNSTAQYVGSGGIIGDKYILSAAHPFLNEGYKLQSKKYTVYVGTVNYNLALNEPRNSVILPVERIFVSRDYSADTSPRRFDIAVLELTVALTKRTRNWQKLNLPVRNVVIGDQGVVAAFGTYKLSPIPDSRFLKSENDGKLRYANINITRKGGSRVWYYKTPLPFQSNVPVQSEHFVGLMKKDSTDIYGMCYGDSGALLVQNSNTAIGVVITITNPICDGRKAAAIFINVYDRVPFIQRAMSGDHRNMHVKQCRP